MLVDINLLPEKERERSTLLLAALAILGVAVLFWAVLYFISNAMEKETAVLESQQAALQQEQQAVRDLLPVSDHLDARKQLDLTVQWAETVQFDTVPLLEDMIHALPERGFFRSFEFTAPNSATVVVQFDAKPEASHYFSRLASSESIEHLVLDSVTAETVTEEESDVTHDVMPRFLATYSITFVDERNLAEQPVEESADEMETDAEGGGTVE
ncbi:fimbrial assembly protein [Sporosarcina sp. 179-K 3D1 HS]|uniref:fimbrial assembly protein n=1 Tax=Sporosarcina sp. 179-K 3D1 HS TaxID=3232169 RepID=UPI0039A30700